MVGTDRWQQASKWIWAKSVHISFWNTTCGDVEDDLQQSSVPYDVRIAVWGPQSKWWVPERGSIVVELA